MGGVGDPLGIVQEVIQWQIRLKIASFSMEGQFSLYCSWKKSSQKSAVFAGLYLI